MTTFGGRGEPSLGPVSWPTGPQNRCAGYNRGPNELFYAPLTPAPSARKEVHR